MTLTVPAAAAGTYMLPVFYVSGNTMTFTAQLTINGGVPINVTYPATGGNIGQVAEMGVFVPLQAGSNTIKLSSTGAMGNLTGVGTPLLQP